MVDPIGIGPTPPYFLRYRCNCIPIWFFVDLKHVATYLTYYHVGRIFIVHGPIHLM